jgi:hypothetical protein
VFEPGILTQIDAELTQAEAARAAGFEGRARVCARRAAGIAIRAYLQVRHEAPAQTSAYDLLQYMQNRTSTLPEVRVVVNHLLTRVNPEFQLTVAVDLIAETRWLIKTLNEDL